MSTTTAQQIVDRAALLMGDSNHELYTEAQKLSELNNLLTEISSRTNCFKKGAEIQIQDTKRVYDFPADMLELRQMTIEIIDGDIIFGTSYESLVNSGDDFNSANTLGEQWHAPLSGGRLTKGSVRVHFRDLVSDNEFIVDPVITQDNVVPYDKTELYFGNS